METERIERNSDSQEKIKEKRESNFRIRTSQRITLRVYTIFHLVRARFTAKRNKNETKEKGERFS